MQPAWTQATQTQAIQTQATQTQATQTQATQTQVIASSYVLVEEAMNHMLYKIHKVGWVMVANGVEPTYKKG